MRKCNALSLLVALCLSTPLYADLPSGFINEGWLICGPFHNPPAENPEPGKVTRCPGLDTDYLTEHGGESSIVPHVGMTHKKKDGSTVAWFAYDSPEDRVAFRKAITREADVVGYAYRVINADKAGRYLLALGSDEGVCLWINGKQVHYNYIKRVIKADDELVPITLKKGDNHILIKVEQRNGGWGFIMRFLPEDEVLTAIDTDTDQLIVNISLQMQASDLRKTVELLADDKLIQSAPLVESHDGAVANAAIELPFPSAGSERDYASLDVVVNGKKLADLEMPLFDKIRIEHFRWLAPRGYPGCVFDGQELPRMDFEKPQLAQKLIGPYTIETTYYDRDYNVVTEAKQPGRYGAVVDIKTATMNTRRFVTLFRQKEGVDWWHYKLEADVSLPEGLGIPDKTAKEYREHVNDFIKGQLAEGLRKDHGGAVLLAALHEATSDCIKSSYYSAPNLRDRAWWLALKRKLCGADKKYDKAFVCPTHVEGPAVNIVREGSLQEAGMKKDFENRMHEHLSAWEADTDEAFAVIVVRHGVIAFHRAYGMRDGEPMTLETQSWMASTTKMMSATLIMMLVDQGLLDLDSRVDDFLPPLKNASSEWPATIRNLYMHTASLRGHWGSWMNDMEYRVAEKIPYYTVGEKCVYDGAGLEVACKALEVISGETLPQFYQNHLFKPLGIENTDVSDSCGGASSVPLDMAKICQMLLQKGAYGNMRFFSEDTFEKMLPRKAEEGAEPVIGGQFGIGTTWFKHDGLGEGTFAHGAASSATTRIDPENDLVIVMTRNASGSNFGKYHKGFIDLIVEGME